MTPRQKVAVFDFDGVISTYNGWRGFDVFGEPIPSTIKVMNDLQSQGWRIVIFTTRHFTPAMQEWLRIAGVTYDDVNNTKHNPPHTSNKPIADVYVDDRAVNFHGQSAPQLMDEIKGVANSKGSPLDVAKEN